MKFVKVLSLSVALLVSSTAGAQGIEEICSNMADSDASIFVKIKEDPSFLDYALNQLAATKMSTAAKTEMRERLFFINNRQHMTVDQVRRLSFIRCLTQH